MISTQLLKKYYSGDSWNGTLTFYNWVRSFIRHEFVVLNVGEGPTTEDRIKSLKGEVENVVGADVDPIVLNNKLKYVHNSKILFLDYY